MNKAFPESKFQFVAKSQAELQSGLAQIGADWFSFREMRRKYMLDAINNHNGARIYVHHRNNWDWDLASHNGFPDYPTVKVPMDHMVKINNKFFSKESIAKLIN